MINDALEDDNDNSRIMIMFFSYGDANVYRNLIVYGNSNINGNGSGNSNSNGIDIYNSNDPSLTHTNDEDLARSVMFTANTAPAF